MSRRFARVASLFALTLLTAPGCLDDAEAPRPGSEIGSELGSEAQALSDTPVLEFPTQGQLVRAADKRQLLFKGHLASSDVFASIAIQIRPDPRYPDWVTLREEAVRKSWAFTVDFAAGPPDGGLYDPDLAWPLGGLAQFRVLQYGIPIATTSCDATRCTVQPPTGDGVITVADSTPPPAAAGDRRRYLFKQALLHAVPSGSPAGTPAPEFTDAEYAAEIAEYYNNLYTPDGTPTFPVLLTDYLTKYGISNADDGMIYYNSLELGWGRNLRCNTWWTGVVGAVHPTKGFTCYVINYDDGNHGPPGADPDLYLDGAVAHQLHGDTSQIRNYVIIHYNPGVPSRQRVQFGAYAKDSAGIFVRQDKVTLDSGAPRPTPMVCVNCHGGTYDKNDNTVYDASFLPLNINDIRLPAADLSPAFTRAAQERSVEGINIIAFNTDPKFGVRDYIANLYGFNTAAGYTAPVVTPPANPTPIPAAWQDEPKLYRDVYEPYCQSCHRATAQGSGFGIMSSGAEFRKYLGYFVGNLCAGEPTMPHSELIMRNLWNSQARATLVEALGASNAAQPRTPGATLTIGACAPNNPDTLAPTGAERVFRAAVQEPIIDFSYANGVTPVIVPISVAESFDYRALAVTVNLRHTWIGDLKIELLRDGAWVATLADRVGGSADDLHHTYDLGRAGSDSQATWALRVTDLAAQDSGVIDDVTLTFTANRRYENVRGLAISDYNQLAYPLLTPTTAVVPVPDAFSFESVDVTVDIAHSYIGDLRVVLVKDGVPVATLANRVGDSDDDLHQVFTLTAAAVGGTSATGVWSVEVTDLAQGDVGTLSRVMLDFH